MSQRPVLVARASAHATHILAATDFTDPAYPALHYASMLANRVGANLTLLHHFDSAKVSLLAPPFSGMLSRWPPATICWTASAAWSQLFRLATHFGAETATVVTESGSTAGKIVSEAAARRADLIVLGAHSKGLLPHWLHRSAEVEVLAQAAASVMLVPLGGT